MPKSKEFISSDDSESSGADEPKAKKRKSEEKAKKKEKAEKEKETTSYTKGPGGEYMFEIARNKFATVSQFKGKTYVGIREFYEKDGKVLPTKKGINLSIDQWQQLKSMIPELDECVKKF